MARTLLAVVAVAFGLLAHSPAQAVVVPALKQPAWVELSQQQREILAPLRSDWNNLEPWRKKKWIGIAERYPSMSPEEQARVQRRMQEWARLAPEERKAVREKYKNLQKASPEHKENLKQRWQEYKQLPDEEKQRLKEEAAKPKPRAGRVPRPGPTGASAKPLTPAPLPPAVPALPPPAPSQTAPAVEPPPAPVTPPQE